MSGEEDRTTVAVDASVLINLIQAGRLDLLSAIRRWVFLVPDQAAEEVSYPEHAAVLDQALQAGDLHVESITDLMEMACFADLRSRMGRGEAACLAMAEQRGWTVASDDRGRAFLRIVRERIGEERLIDTAEIVRAAHQEKVISRGEADGLLQSLGKEM